MCCKAHLADVTITVTYFVPDLCLSAYGITTLRPAAAVNEMNLIILHNFPIQCSTVTCRIECTPDGFFRISGIDYADIIEQYIVKGLCYTHDIVVYLLSVSALTHFIRHCLGFECWLCVLHDRASSHNCFH